MYSGLALVMDVYHPKAANGHGIIHLTGSGWHTAVGYDAVEQKASRQVDIFGGKLVEAGYTVFARVIDGMTVVEEIELVDTHLERGMAAVPETPVVIQTIRRKAES